MGTLNKALLIGRLGKDPELKYTSNGTAKLAFSLATSEYYKDQAGEKVEKTTWHNIVMWGQRAETMANYLKKGKLVFVEGKIDNRSYDKDDGTKGYANEVVALNLQILDKKEDAGGDEYGEEQQREAKRPAETGKYQAPAVSAEDYDDIPFNNSPVYQ